MSIKPTIPDNPEIEVVKAGKTGLFTNYIFKAIPLAFDESMSYYETLCGLLNYLKNTIIPTVNNNADAVSELQTLYEELKTFVDDYFTNLDVQEEINNKLDAMVEDGTFGTLLAPYLQSFNDRLDDQDETLTLMNSHLQQETEERQGADAQLQTQISNIVASAGTEGTSSSEIVQARTNTQNITFPALNDRINYIENTTPFGNQSVQNADLNNLLVPKNYWVYGTILNHPTLKDLDFSTNTAYVIVEGLNPERNSTTGEITHYRCLIQRYYPYYNGATGFCGFFTRLIKWNGTTSAYVYEPWNVTASSFINYIYQPDNKVYRYALSEDFAGNGGTSAQTDLNDLLIQGNWLLTNANNLHAPTGLSVGYVHNEVTTVSGNKWIMQTFSTAQGDAIYQRMIFARANDPIYYDWKKIYPVENGNISLTCKKIVNFGDSIFGNYQGTTSVSQNIANITGATVYNVGFGGCQMSDRSDTGWKAFSMCNLADAVANQDFTMQDNAVADTSWVSKPNYFDSHLATLKNIDFSTVDIVTIAYGTNDYTAGDLLDNENNLKDIDTFAGALRYSIETLLTAYPNLKIVIGTPLFRLWLNDGVVEETSDTKKYAGNYTLIDMTDKVKNIGKEYHCQVIDAYNDFGVNQYNWQRIFDSTDTTHPNQTGRALLGRLYGVELLK